MNTDPLAGVLYKKADKILERSYVPYSSQGRSAVLLLDDGAMIPGVRVENASFSLTITAVINAISTAVALGRTDIQAIALSDVATPGDEAFLERHPFGPFTATNKRLYVREGTDQLAKPGSFLDPILQPLQDCSNETAIQAARDVSSRAFIPESQFPVGCLVELSDGRLIAGVNVEHPLWPQIICAERNAFGTAVSYGLNPITKLYLSSPVDQHATPCGACRQVLVELAPEAAVWMDRGIRDAEHARIDQLLPGFFSGNALRRSL